MSWIMTIDVLNAKVRRLCYRIKQYHGYDLPIVDENCVQYNKELGRGSEGIVHSCIIKLNGRIVKAAAKRVLHASIDSIKNFLNEVFILSIGMQNKQRTTPKLIGIGISSGKFLKGGATVDDDESFGPQIVIYTELGIMNLMDLYINESDIPISITVNLWSEIASMLYTLHMNGIIHRDLKPENILVVKIDRDYQGEITKIYTRIMDVGMSYLRYVMDYDDIFGTMGYHSPEMLAEEDYDSSSDIFTLGILFIVTLLPLHKHCFNLPRLLLRIDKLKKESILGRKLYTILNFSFGIPKTLENMICTMIEEQSKRHITLSQIQKICKIFSMKSMPESNINIKQQCTASTKVLILHERRNLRCNSDSYLEIKMKSPLRLRSRIIKRNYFDIENMSI